MSDLAVTLYAIAAACLLMLAPMPGWVLTEHRRIRHQATRGRFNQHGPLVTPGRHRTPAVTR